MTATATLSRSLRARQAAARCDTMAANCETKAARFPEGSALREDWTRLAEEYRGTAAQWRTGLDAARRQCLLCPKRANSSGYCAEHDDL